MATGQLGGVIQHLRRAMLLRDGAGRTDGQLLEDYVSRRDEAALAVLVQRHGPMVWGVCRRVLSNYHDAEDTFQATFLVLVRRAASIASPELLANWLYGVAHQTAIKARATVAKRKMRERQVTEMPEPAAVEQNLWNDLQPLLDQELSRLPDKYRGVIVLCDLEGKTRKETAGQLGCAEGTVASRLARARIMLAKRLTQRGVALSGGTLAAVLAQQAASAGVPYSVVDSTIKAASLLAAGKAAATGAISVKVAALTEGVMKAMLFTKLKAAIAVVLILGFVATGATILTCRTAAGQDDKQPTAEKSGEPVTTPEKEKEPFTAWGKEVNGLQAGLGFRPGEQGVRYHWGMVTLVVRVRNVSMKEVTFQYYPQSDWTRLPDVTDAKGKPMAITGGFLPKFCSLKEVNLAPGKSIELWQWNLNLRPESESTKPPPDTPPYATVYGPGKFIIQYPWILPWQSKQKPPTIWAKLGTGKLEIEVKSDPPQKQEQKQQKEGFTAWGKEVGGLQAGLGFRPGEKRAYHHGETVTLVVRVRNVGKESVKFKYLKEFFMAVPVAVEDSEGRPLPALSSGESPNPVAARYRKLREGNPVPGEVNLPPGKETVLYELKLKLSPGVGRSYPEMLDTLRAAGKVSIHYQSLASPDIDANLSKLATGKLEVEITPAPPAEKK